MRSGDDHSHVGQQLRTLTLCALYRRTILLTCPSCKRERRLDAVTLWHLYERKGWSDGLPGALRRLYCATCCKGQGRVVRPLFQITRDRPDAEQPFPYPDERDWKRLVSRHRA